MMLVQDKIYSMKNQPQVLVQVTSLKVEILGPQGTVCVPAIILSSKEEVLIPVASLADAPKKEELSKAI